MKQIIRILVSAFIIYFVCIDLSYADSDNDMGLEMLEQMASEQINSGYPDVALEVYRQYENNMLEEGWSGLQPDLLKNQAIAAYRVGRYGECMAYLKQLSIVDETLEIREMISELQTLIEHRVYQKSPNLAFVRGNGNEYSSWKMTHQFSENYIRICLMGCLTCFFILASFMVIFRKRRAIFYIFLAISVVMFIFSCGIGLLWYCWKSTDELQFGVLLDDFTLRVEPGIESKIIEDRAFVPGMTVNILSTVPGWVKVGRVDRVVGWVENYNCYLLRGDGQEKSWRIEQ